MVKQSLRRNIHNEKDGRKENPLQNLPRGVGDPAELVQCPGGHEEQARSPAQPRHPSAHDCRRTQRRILR